MDPQKGDPSGSPKRRSKWISKKAIQVDLQKGDPLYPYWMDPEKGDPGKGDPLYPYWMNPEKGDPGGSQKRRSTLCLPLLTEWIPKKLVHTILTFIKWIPKLGNRFKMDPQKPYTLHLVDRLSFAVSSLEHVALLAKPTDKSESKSTRQDLFISPICHVSPVESCYVSC